MVTDYEELNQDFIDFFDKHGWEITKAKYVPSSVAPESQEELEKHILDKLNLNTTFYRFRMKGSYPYDEFYLKDVGGDGNLMRADLAPQPSKAKKEILFSLEGILDTILHWEYTKKNFPEVESDQKRYGGIASLGRKAENHKTFRDGVDKLYKAVKEYGVRIGLPRNFSNGEDIEIRDEYEKIVGLRHIPGYINMQKGNSVAGWFVNLTDPDEISEYPGIGKYPKKHVKRNPVDRGRGR